MPNYFNKVIAILHHPTSINPQHSPHPYNAPIYGQKRQIYIPTNTNEKLNPSQLNNCQELFGFSINMLELLKTPYKHPPAPSPRPFQQAHGKRSNLESINFLTIWPLTLMQIFDLIQAKCTYEFTQTPLISMNKKLSLTMVVSSKPLKTQTPNQTK